MHFGGKLIIKNFKVLTLFIVPGDGSAGVDPSSSNYPDNIYSWCVQGPFDLNQGNIDSAFFEFYHWTKTELNFDFLFFGFSIHPDSNYWGYSLSGDFTNEPGNQNGWLFFSQDLSNVPHWGNLVGQQKLYILFAFFSDGSINEKGSFLDNVRLRAGDGGMDVNSQVVSSNFPLVLNYVSVVDKSGNPVTNLPQSNFSFKENGTQQSIQCFGNVSNTTGSEVSVGLVLDRSGSMSGTPLNDLKTAATTFVNLMQPNDKGEVISFESVVTIDQSYTTDKNALITAINNIAEGNMTSLYDAIYTT